MKEGFAKGFQYLGSLLLNSVFSLLFFVVSSIRYVIVGEKLLLKSAILVGYTVMIWSGLRHPVLFASLLGFILAVAFFFGCLMVKHHDAAYEENGQKSICDTGKIPFFDGMTAEKAKKEYRRLMRKYHPDNSGGDVEMTQQVIAAYQRFQMVNGK